MYETPEQELAHLQEQGLLRDLQALPRAGGEIVIDGRHILNFSSNDYLGLANDARLKSAAIKAIEDFGSGATSSRLMAGHTALNEELEADLAGMMGFEAALVFGSGYLTNIGVITSLTGRGDIIYSDELNHASIIDGVRLSRAKCERYRHKDMEHLEALLKNSSSEGKRVIVTESVFSMDGDIAPLKDISVLAKRYGALLVVDEAHAIGVFGAKGGGVNRILGAEVKVDVAIGTFSKALGGYGGFAACSAAVRRLFINKARSFIFTTGLPPASLASAKEAVKIVSSGKPGRELLARASNFHKLLIKNGLKVPSFESQIMPIIVGGNEETVQFAQRLWESGLLIKGVRPPTVPPGTSRVRLSLSLALSEASLGAAAETIARAAKEMGIA